MRRVVSARALRVLAFVALCGLCMAGIAALPSWGSLWAGGAVDGALLVGLLLVPSLWRDRVAGAPAGRRSRFPRLLGWARTPLAVVLVGWLGLIGWAQFSPGGPLPRSKADPAGIRVVTWNVLRGEETGPPWQRANWPARKHALRAALGEAAPDVLCLQEALAEQLAFLEEGLSGYRRVGIPRPDGEHC